MKTELFIRKKRTHKAKQKECRCSSYISFYTREQPLYVTLISAFQQAALKQSAHILMTIHLQQHPI